MHELNAEFQSLQYWFSNMKIVRIVQSSRAEQALLTCLSPGEAEFAQPVLFVPRFE